VKAVASLNNIKNPRKIRAGQLLKIPGGFVSVAQKQKTESKKQTSSAHRVRKGESLSTIASKYNTSVKAVASLNNIKNPRKIKVGQLLKIPEGTVLLAQKKETQTKHRVKKGQTLIAIAKRYNTSAKAIARLNNIKNPRKLQTGQLLKIPKG
jgi:LysM repeat protein